MSSSVDPVTQSTATSIPSAQPRSIPPWMKALAGVAAVFLVLSAYALINYPTRSFPADKPAPPTALTPDYAGDVFQISPFQLVDQDGDTVSEAVFYKRVTIAAWVFSNCPLACPTIMAQMVNLQRDLADTSVQFVAMGLDPAHDSPSVMKQWGQKLGVDWSRWKFITEPHPLPDTGPALTARQLLVNDMKVHVEEKGNDPITLADGSTMDNIIHPFEVYLLGPKGQLIARFSVRRQEEVDALRQRARAAAAELDGRLGVASSEAAR